MSENRARARGMHSRIVRNVTQKVVQQHPRRRMYHQGRRWWFWGLMLCTIGAFFTMVRSGWRAQFNSGTTTDMPVTKFSDDYDTQRRMAKDLVVHLIPHSHVDPGWLFSIDEYYDYRVRHILANTVRHLVLDRRRTFVWETVAYLDRFLRDRGGDRFTLWDTREQELTERASAAEGGAMIRVAGSAEDTPSQPVCHTKGFCDGSWRDVIERLLQRGQLELLGGGWVSHDEALVSPRDAVDQLALGLGVLRQHFPQASQNSRKPVAMGTEENVAMDTMAAAAKAGANTDATASAFPIVTPVASYARPKIAWQLDPFGSAALTPMVFGDSSYDALVINRMHHTTKSRLIRDRSLEFEWRFDIPSTSSAFSLRESTGDRSSSSVTDSSVLEIPKMLTHVLFDHYNSPWLDFEGRGTVRTLHGRAARQRLRGDGSEARSMRNDVHAMRKQAHLRATALPCMQQGVERMSSNECHLMILLGDDFRFQNPASWFTHIEEIIEDASGRGLQFRFSTPSQYFAAAFGTFPPPERTLHASLRSFTGDFFPYADQPMENYWSGYYSSHPRLKRQARTVAALVVAAESLHASLARFAISSRNTYSGKPAMEPIALTAIGQELRALRRTRGLLQHHDAITGTCTATTHTDYLIKLKQASTRTWTALSSLLTLALGSTSASDTWKPLESEHVLQLTGFPDGQRVLLYNPMPRTRRQHVSIRIYAYDREDVEVLKVLDAGERAAVPSQVTLIAENSTARGENSRGENIDVIFVADLPPLGTQEYVLRLPHRRRTYAAQQKHVIRSNVSSWSHESAAFRVSVGLVGDGALSVGLCARQEAGSPCAKISHTFRWYGFHREMVHTSGAYLLRTPLTGILETIWPLAGFAYGTALVTFTCILALLRRVVFRSTDTLAAHSASVDKPSRISMCLPLALMVFTVGILLGAGLALTCLTNARGPLSPNGWLVDWVLRLDATGTRNSVLTRARNILPSSFGVFFNALASLERHATQANRSLALGAALMTCYVIVIGSSAVAASCLCVYCRFNRGITAESHVPMAIREKVADDNARRQVLRRPVFDVLLRDAFGLVVARTGLVFGGGVVFAAVVFGTFVGSFFVWPQSIGAVVDGHSSATKTLDVQHGDLLTQIKHVPASGFSLTMRIFHDDARHTHPDEYGMYDPASLSSAVVEFVQRVPPASRGQSREVSSRFGTDWALERPWLLETDQGDSGGTWFATDDGVVQRSRRYTFSALMPASVFPAVTSAFIQRTTGARKPATNDAGNRAQLALLTAQSLGATTFENGLELMLTRDHENDDQRGMNEGVHEGSEPVDVRSWLTLLDSEHRDEQHLASRSHTARRRELADAQENPILAFTMPVANRNKQFSPRWSGLQRDVPRGLRLLSIQTPLFDGLDGFEQSKSDGTNISMWLIRVQLLAPTTDQQLESNRFENTRQIATDLLHWMQTHNVCAATPENLVFDRAVGARIDGVHNIGNSRIPNDVLNPLAQLLATSRPIALRLEWCESGRN